MKNGLIIDKDGNKAWWLNGELHRVDGPAIEWHYGTKEWYLNGDLHREDGPAVIYPDGTKLWCLNGEIVYSYNINFLHKYPNLSKPFKKSIIKHKLSN
jgi:hypothetical protein